MSRDLKIWINGTEAEVEQGANPISFTYSIEGTEPGKVGGAFAKRSIILPGTKGNHRIFENLDQPETIPTNANKLLPARAEVGGLPVLTGRAQLSRAGLASFRHGLRASSYQVSFVGANADWFQDIGGLLVRQLGWEDVTLSVANYDALGSADPLTDDICFLLMKWKAWERETEVLYTELTPALFFGAILRRAFQSIGYTLETVFEDDPFNRVCVPVPLKLDGDYAANFINMQASLAAYEVQTTGGYQEFDIIFDDDSTDPNFDGGNNYNTTTGEYTVPLNALYSIIVEFVLPIFLDADNHSVNIMVNGSAVGGQFVADAGPYIIEYIGELNAGDVVSILWTCQDQTPFIPDFNTTDWVLRIEAEKERWNLDEDLAFDYIIPGTWFVKDFIQDATRIFNLAWETDVLSRTVRAYPKDRFTVTYRPGGTGAGTTNSRDGFFLEGGETDLAPMVDIGEGGDMELMSDRTQDYVLAWGTGDPTTEELEKRSATSLYSARYRNTTGRFPAGATWLYTQYFAKTIHINDAEVSSGGDKAPQIPLLFGKDYYKEPDAEPDYTLNPRLLYFAGRRSGDDGYIKIYNENTSATNAYDYPAAWQVNYNDSSAVDFSLSFADEVTNYGGTVRGLFKMLHLQKVRRMEDGRQYRLSVRWDELQISALSFRRALTWQGQRMLLERIDGYTPTSDRATLTDIIPDILPTIADAAKVAGPVLLEGATQNSLTSLGAINGVVTPGGGGSTAIVVYRYRQLIQDSTSRFITLPGTSGILDVPNPYVVVTVNQNGKILTPELEFTISGPTITVEEFTHFDGCTYFITIHDAV